MVERGQLLIIRGQVAVEPDDIAVITSAGAGKQQERSCFDQGGIEATEDVEGAQVPPRVDTG